MMTVLVTGAATPVGQVLATGLSDEHQVRLTDRQDALSPRLIEVGDLQELSFAEKVTAGVDAIVHVPVTTPEPSTEVERLAQLDWAMRSTYNLLHAAVNVGVQRCVLISSLSVMEGYPSDWLVTEQWKPKPLPAMDGLAYHLSELIAREFARATPLAVICLRWGKLVREEQVRNLPFDPLWLDERDAVRAVCNALTMPLERRQRQQRWWVFHIVPDHPHTRFPLFAASGSPLRFQPQRNFTPNRR